MGQWRRLAAILVAAATAMASVQEFWRDRRRVDLQVLSVGQLAEAQGLLDLWRSPHLCRCSRHSARASSGWDHALGWDCALFRAFVDCQGSRSWHGTSAACAAKHSHGGAQVSVPPQGALQQHGEQPSRQALFGRLKVCEQALATLPDEEWCAPQRIAMTQQREALRKQISETKSLGARLDGWRAALERAKQRRAHAQEIAAAAAAAQDKANQDVVRLSSELAELEQHVRSEQTKEQNADCVTRLHSEMSAVVAEMTGSGNVDQAEIAATKSAMEQLFWSLSNPGSRICAAASRYRCRQQLCCCCGHVGHSGRRCCCVLSRSCRGCTPAEPVSLADIAGQCRCEPCGQHDAQIQ